MLKLILSLPTLLVASLRRMEFRRYPAEAPIEPDQHARRSLLIESLRRNEFSCDPADARVETDQYARYSLLSVR